VAAFAAVFSRLPALQEMDRNGTWSALLASIAPGPRKNIVNRKAEGL
jgi:hypothetical protein